jgi:hypothetical protein
MKKEIFGAIFGNNPYISLDERVRVITELEKIGSINFSITLSEEGWMAQCIEVPGIIASNLNPNPTDTEIEDRIRDAIYAAFNVKFDKKPEEGIPSPFAFSYTVTNPGTLANE